MIAFTVCRNDWQCLSKFILKVQICHFVDGENTESSLDQTLIQLD